jgi:hypothetical protein
MEWRGSVWVHEKGWQEMSSVEERADLMQAENFHTKKWFQQDEASHGYNGPLDNEPHDLVC